MYPSTPLGRLIAVFSLVLALLLLGCSEPVGLATADGELRADRRFQYTLTVTPGNHSMFVGNSIGYVATVTDRSGRRYESGSIEWRVSDSRIARIASSGELVALAAGDATVTAVVYGLQTSVPLVVRQGTGTTLPPTGTQPSANAEPMFNASLHQSLWFDDFESTASTASIHSRYNTLNGENGLHLDASGGQSGSKGMRIDWQPRSGCSDDGHLIEASIAPSQEVVVQYSVRYQANFAFDWIGRGGACGGNAKKLFFLWAATGSRFDFISENHTLGVGPDDRPLFAQHLGTAVTPEALGNGQWHRITLRVRQSSTPTATDGYIHGWIDGVQKWAVNNIASHASGGWVLFKLPTTFNQGSPVQQSEWMDDFRIWRP